MLLRSDCPAGFSQTRSSLKVSQPCGLKNDLLCSRPLRAYSHLEHRDASRSGIAHCVRWVARLYQKPSLSCHRWVMTGQDDWTSRRLHLSCLTGQASSTGRQKPSLVLPRWTLCKLPEAFTRPPAFGWPGRLDFLRLCLWGVSDSPLRIHPFWILWERLPPTVPQTYPHHPQPERPHTGNLDQPQSLTRRAEELQCGRWRLCRCTWSL